MSQLKFVGHCLLRTVSGPLSLNLAYIPGTVQSTFPVCFRMVHGLAIKDHPDSHDDCCGIQEHCLCTQMRLEPSAIGRGARKPVAGSWGDAPDWHFRKYWPEACSSHSRHLQEPHTAASTGSAGSLPVPAKPALCLGRLRLCAAGSCCLQVNNCGFQIGFEPIFPVICKMQSCSYNPKQTCTGCLLAPVDWYKRCDGMANRY